MNAVETENQKVGQHRVTYHAVNRTFDRLFRETSLKEMQEVVRRKLGLPENTEIMLSQVRGGQLIDLEDDDDFDAFSAVAHSAVSVEVKVTVHQATELSIVTQAPTPNNEESCANSNSQYEDFSISSRKRKVAFSKNEELARSPSVDREQVLPPSKRRRSNPGLKPKMPGVNQGNLVPSNDDPAVQTGRLMNSNTSDEDVVMEPSASSAPPPPLPPSPPIIPTTDYSSAAPDSFTIDPDPPSNSPRDSPSATLSLTESKRKQRKAGKAPEEAKNEDKEEITSAKAGEQSGRRKKKEKMRAAEAENNQENVAVVQVEDKMEKKRRKKKAKSDKGVIESELLGQEKFTSSPAPEFPEQLAKAISGNTEYEYKPEKDVKKMKKGKQLESDRINAQPTSVVNDARHDKGPLARGRDTISLPEQTAEDTVSVKKKKARQKPKTTAKSPPTDEKQPEKSSDVSVTVAEIIKAKRKNAESSRSALTSELAPTTEESRSNRSKNPVSKKIPEKPPPIQTLDESDSDDSIKALRLAAQQPYLKKTENKTLLDIDIEEVVRGPSARRLTLDRMMRVDIVGQHKETDVVLEEEEDMPKRRRSIAARMASSDSDLVDDEGDESEDALGKRNLSRKPSVPPVLHVISSDNTPDALRAKSSGSFTSMTEPEVDPHVAYNDGTNEADSSSVDQKGKAEDSSDSNYPSRTPPGDDDDDPIEPIPSPARQPSPIQVSQGDVHVSPLIGRMKKRGGLISIPAPPAICKPGKTVGGQPVSIHEAAVRESFMKMTTSRAKVAASTLSPNLPSPPQPRGPDATEGDTPKHTLSTQSPVVTPGRDQAEDVDVGWTTLAVSSPAEPESSFTMLDQLQSSSEAESGSPLFLPSETQPGFPFSQWRDSQSQGTNDHVHLPHDSEDEDDDEEEEEVAALASVTSNKKRPSVPPTFRSLTQIASQSKMYSSPLLPPSTAPQPKTRTTTKRDLYGSVANGYGDESESSSESDEGTSHIPKARIAGKKSL